MRKFLGFILVLALILGSVSMIFADADPVVYTQTGLSAEGAYTYDDAVVPGHVGHKTAAGHRYQTLVISAGSDDLTVVGGEYKRIEVAAGYTGILTLKDVTVNYCSSCNPDKYGIVFENTGVAEVVIDGTVTVNYEEDSRYPIAVGSFGGLTISAANAAAVLNINNTKGYGIYAVGDLTVNGLAVNIKSANTSVKTLGDFTMVGPNAAVFAESTGDRAIEIYDTFNNADNYCAFAVPYSADTLEDVLANGTAPQFGKLPSFLDSYSFWNGTSPTKTVYFFPQYTVTFDANGGSFAGGNTVENKTYNPQLNVDFPAPTNSGYYLAGWSTSASGYANVSANAAFTENTTVYAVWSRIVYSVAAPAADDKCKQDESCPIAQFEDLDPKAENHDAVHFVVEKEFMVGYEDGLFRGEKEITRAELLATLYRFVKANGQGFTGDWMFMLDYEDAAEIPSWAYEPIAWFTMKGIVNGYTNGCFGANDIVERKDAVRIYYEIAKFMEYDVSIGEETNILSYDDAFAIPENYIPAIQWACGSGVFSAEGSNLNLNNGLVRIVNAEMLFNFATGVAGMK